MLKLQDIKYWHAYCLTDSVLYEVRIRTLFLVWFHIFCRSWQEFLLYCIGRSGTIFRGFRWLAQYQTKLNRPVIFLWVDGVLITGVTPTHMSRFSANKDRDLMLFLNCEVCGTSLKTTTALFFTRKTKKCSLHLFILYSACLH